MTVLDISVTIVPGATPVWPGDPQPERTLIWTLGQGSLANVSRLLLSAHTLTHVDAPIHFIAGGEGIERLDIEALVGPCIVAEVSPAGRHISEGDLEAAGINPGTRRLLIKTANSRLWQAARGVFYPEFIALTAAAAQWIVDRGIKLVGIDYLSVEPFEHREPVVHRALLGAGVVVVEGLDLSGVLPGAYTLACLPLKILGCDGAPARAVLTY